VYDVIYERVMIETCIKIAGIFILIILLRDDVRFVLKLVAKNKLYSTKYLLYLTGIWSRKLQSVSNNFSLWQFQGTKFLTSAFLFLNTVMH